jgi:cytochrome c biogenesis protein ResB
MADPIASLSRFVRAPRTIVALLLVIALAGVAAATIPQVTTDPGGVLRLRRENPMAASIATALGLDNVLHSRWFLVVLTAAATSLGLALRDQWARAARLWRQIPDDASLARAQFRLEFVRPRRSPAAPARFEARGRVGHLGSPVFHSGLALVVVAGVARALFAVDAAVDLFEGEVLPGDASGYRTQWTGPLARPFSLGEPVRLRELRPGWYPSGRLRELRALVAVGGGGDAPAAELGINLPLEVGRDRLYVTGLVAPAAFLELRGQGGEDRQAILLEPVATADPEATLSMGDGWEVRMRAPAGTDLPGAVLVRVLRHGVLAHASSLSVGEAVALPDGSTLTLADVRRWARFVGSRDASAPLAYVGFGVAIVGALLMLVIRTDAGVWVEPSGAEERIVVALRAHRFAPLFEDRFQELARDEGFDRSA